MDDTDRHIVAALQAGLPNSPTPYADVAAAQGLEVDELLARLARMVDEGIVRCVRAVLDQRLLGLAGNVLVAWRVEGGCVEKAGMLFASRDEVTHCVERPPAPDWPYTLYTMVHAPTEADCRAIVAAMAAESGVTEFVKLTTLRELKKTPPRYF